jgi:hypothetical protein
VGAEIREGGGSPVTDDFEKHVRTPHNLSQGSYLRSQVLLLRLLYDDIPVQRFRRLRVLVFDVKPVETIGFHVARNWDANRPVFNGRVTNFVRAHY